MQPQDQSAPKRYLEQLAIHTSQIFFSYDVNSKRFLYLNPAFEQVLQRSSLSAGRNPELLLQAVHSSDRDYLINEFNKVGLGEINKDIEFRIALPDKSIKWLRLNAFLDEQDSARTIITGWAEDISKWKAKDEYIKKYAAKKNSVLEILAHDLAGPLNNINLASSFMAERTKEQDDPKLNELIEIVKRTSERSIRLIREFVAKEFLEATSVDVIKRRVDMVRNLKELMDQYKTSSEIVKKNFQLRHSHDQVFINVDDIKFRQVINNLISNAIKFTPDYGTITLIIEDKQKTVLFTVEDDGIGIPEQYHDTLFSKFTQARRDGLKGEPSTGLGMSIIKTIVEWHNGSVWFRSQENKGTTFYIELPRE